jgi:hypothetical protein
MSDVVTGKAVLLRKAVFNLIINEANNAADQDRKYGGYKNRTVF